MYNNQENETDKAERVKKLKALLTEFHNIKSRLRLLEQDVTEIRNGMSVIVLNL